MYARGGAGGGAQLSRATRKIEDLQSKMMKQSEQLMEAQKKQIEYADKLADVTGRLRKNEDELGRKESRWVGGCTQQDSQSGSTGDLIHTHTP